jgi:hypothetical protein
MAHMGIAMCLVWLALDFHQLKCGISAFYFHGHYVANGRVNLGDCVCRLFISPAPRGKVRPPRSWPI